MIVFVDRLGNILANIFTRPVVPGGAGGAKTPPDFGRSVNPISTRRGRLCPPHYYWHPRIFRPSYGPVYIGKIDLLIYFLSSISTQYKYLILQKVYR